MTETGQGSSVAPEAAEVWVADDDQSIRWVLERALTRAGLRVRSFPQATEVLAALTDAEPAVLVSDIRMPGASGIELLYQVRQQRPELPVIIMTAYSDLDSAVSTFQAGAFDYLPKPFDLVQAVALVQRAVRTRQEASAAAPAAAVAETEILGQAPAMQAVYRAIGRLSQSAATVLVTGESGCGKERVAKALHHHSNRAGKPFVALNMAAIPRDLLESELFGHERGAFTGAQAARQGRFEQAQGGTLFLDEIGDMPAEMQTRLLRVLSEGYFYRVGGSQSVKVDVRVIAATHQDLEARVADGRFREDLFHRLNVIRLRLPPLRERLEDVPLLASHFLAGSAASLGIEAKRLSEKAVAALQAFHWPGNVRQLENVCNWLTVMTAAQRITVADLPPEIVAGSAPTASGTGASGTGAAAGEHGPSGTRMAELRHPVVQDDAAAGLLSPAGAPATGTVVRPGGGGLAGVAGEGLSSATGMPLDPAAAGAGAGLADEGAGGAAGLSAAGVGMPVAGAEVSAGPVVPDAQRWSVHLARTVQALLADPSACDLMPRLTAEFERTLVREALHHTAGHRIEAARRLGIGRNTITRKIRELGIGGPEAGDPSI